MVKSNYNLGRRKEGTRVAYTDAVSGEAKIEIFHFML